MFYLFTFFFFWGGGVLYLVCFLFFKCRYLEYYRCTATSIVTSLPGFHVSHFKTRKTAGTAENPARQQTTFICDKQIYIKYYWQLYT